MLLRRERELFAAWFLLLVNNESVRASVANLWKKRREKKKSNAAASVLMARLAARTTATAALAHRLAAHDHNRARRMV